jgi:hypothetical protein
LSKRAGLTFIKAKTSWLCTLRRFSIFLVRPCFGRPFFLDLIYILKAKL